MLNILSLFANWQCYYSLLLVYFGGIKREVEIVSNLKVSSLALKSYVFCCLFLDVLQVPLPYSKFRICGLYYPCNIRNSTTITFSSKLYYYLEQQGLYIHCLLFTNMWNFFRNFPHSLKHNFHVISQLSYVKSIQHQTFTTTFLFLE